MSTEIITVDLDDLRTTWALRGHPTLLRRRWAEAGVDVDSDESVRAFCATADDGILTTLLVDLASMSDEPALNERACIVGERIAEIDGIGGPA